VIAPGYPHHVTQRGNRRQTTFFGDEDYEAYRDLMAEWCLKGGVAIWAWCLMPNHVHLVAVPENEAGLAWAIGEAHRRYTRRVNFRENWTVTEFYYSNARQVVEVRRDGGKTRTGNPLSEPTLATTLREQYVWSPRYVNAPVVRFRDEDTDGQNVETLYYTNDANFNVTALINTSGAVVERYTYDPYGKVTFRAEDWTVRQSSAYANDVLFTGHRLDTETGLYYGGCIRDCPYDINSGGKSIQWARLLLKEKTLARSPGGVTALGSRLCGWCSP